MEDITSASAAVFEWLQNLLSMKMCFHPKFAPDLRLFFVHINQHNQPSKGSGEGFMPIKDLEAIGDELFNVSLLPNTTMGLAA